MALSSLTLKCSSILPSLARILSCFRAVILSAMICEGLTRPVSLQGSTSRRKSGASCSVLVIGQMTMLTCVGLKISD